MSVTGIASFGGLNGTVAALHGLQGQLASVTAANHAVASAITPPGNEGASDVAMAKQQANIQQFGMHFGTGLMYMENLFATMNMDSAAHMATDAASGAIFA